MSGSGASDDASSRLTDSDVEEEMEAMQQKELFKYMTSSVEEQKAIESLESLQKSAGWGKEVRSLWPWIVGVMARFCSNERVQSWVAMSSGGARGSVKNKIGGRWPVVQPLASSLPR